VLDDDIPLAHVLPDIGLPEESRPLRYRSASESGQLDPESQFWPVPEQWGLVPVAYTVEVTVALTGEQLELTRFRLDVPAVGNYDLIGRPESMGECSPVVIADRGHHDLDPKSAPDLALILIVVPPVLDDYSRKRRTKVPADHTES